VGHLAARTSPVPSGLETNAPLTRVEPGRGYGGFGPAERAKCLPVGQDTSFLVTQAWQCYVRHFIEKPWQTAMGFKVR
jgi:hypothetical protein